MTRSKGTAQRITEAPRGDRKGLPGWVSEAARNYLAHTEQGQGIRALAREAPSTVSRRIRRVKSLRDDPLIDSALEALTAGGAERENEAALAREALPVLRRLAEADTVLAVARNMEKGEVPDEEPTRLAVVERRLAEAMALRDWIAGAVPAARIQRYRITPGGGRSCDGCWTGRAPRVSARRRRGSPTSPRTRGCGTRVPCWARARFWSCHAGGTATGGRSFRAS